MAGLLKLCPLLSWPGMDELVHSPDAVDNDLISRVKVLGAGDVISDIKNAPCVVSKGALPVHA